jgi:hypothetical protein
MVWDHEVQGSSPCSPTINAKRNAKRSEAFLLNAKRKRSIFIQCEAQAKHFYSMRSVAKHFYQCEAQAKHLLSNAKHLLKPFQKNALVLHR